MRKIRLDIDALAVESFDTLAGGVLARDSTEMTPCGECDTANTGEQYCADGTRVIWCQRTVAGTCHGDTCETCYGQNTCANSCGGHTCAETCPVGCPKDSVTGLPACCW